MEQRADTEMIENESLTSSEALAKRKASPFTSTMDVALATAFATEKNVLDGTVRSQGVPNRQQKLAAWERIRDCVNAFSGDTNLKTVQQCKDRHRNLIQAAQTSVRFRRNTGLMEGPLPALINNETQEMIESTVASLNDKSSADECGDPNLQKDNTQDSSNGIPSTSSAALCPKDKRSLKRSLRSSSPTGTTDEYRKRKLTIMVKEHIVRMELMKAQTEYYKTKTDLMRQACPRPMSLPQKLQHPNLSKNILPTNMSQNLTPNLPPNLPSKLPGNT